MLYFTLCNYLTLASSPYASQGHANKFGGITDHVLCIFVMSQNKDKFFFSFSEQYNRGKENVEADSGSQCH